MPRFVVLGREENIQTRVGASRPTYTIPVGVGYPDSGILLCVVFGDAVVEYRPTISQEGKPSLMIPNRINAYMKTYASIGLPQARVDWMVNSILEAHEMKVTVDTPKFGTLHNGYCWVNANISNAHEPEGILISRGKATHVGLRSYMINGKKSLLGNVCVTMSLKRVVINENVVRTFGVAFKHIQIFGTTNLCSPRKNYTIGPGESLSARVIGALFSSPRCQTERVGSWL